VLSSPIRGALTRVEPRIRKWWTDKWLSVVGLVLGGLVFLVAGIAWMLAGRPVAGTEGLILQEQMLIAVVQSSLAYAVAMSAIYAARASLRRDRADREKQRRGANATLVGSAIECASHASWIAELQRRGLKKHRSVLPEPRAQRDFLVTGWKLLLTSATAVSRGLETVRYEEPDVVPLAEELFDEVSSGLGAAFEGEVEELNRVARRIREVADALLEVGQAGSESMANRQDRRIAEGRIGNDL
jgi:hypothetical protein